MALAEEGYKNVERIKGTQDPEEDGVASEAQKHGRGRIVVIRDWSVPNCKDGGDPFMVLEGAGKEGRPFRCSCVPEEMSLDHGCLPNIDLLCLTSRTLRKALPPTLHTLANRHLQGQKSTS